MQVSITVDMENDCPPYLTSFKGITEGTPALLDLLGAEDVRGTFFTTGDIARRFPETVRAIVARGHELGCHGDTHRRFSELPAAAAQREIDDATQVLRGFCDVTSFRAPYLDFPEDYLPMLSAAGYTHDSSQGRYKRGSVFAAPRQVARVQRVPASTMPSVVRLPRLLRNAILGRLRNPVVLFFHPWEFVDMTRARIPYDCRFRTGGPALATLRDTIRYFRRRGASFRLVKDLP